MTGVGDTAHYLIAAPPAVLGGLVQILDAAASSQVLSAKTTSSGQLERLSVMMPRPLAETLKDALAGVALIEEDQVVNPL
jgi:hypothetical protein